MIARTALRTAVRPACIDASRATAVRFYAEDQFGRKEEGMQSNDHKRKPKNDYILRNSVWKRANFLRISYNV
ncbi:hypothetical protein RSAG8_10556, partial [Rhizoctonia solani AG-8 WAC10335]